MQFNALALWNKYVQYCLEHFFSQHNKNIEDGLPYLRDKLFFSVLLISFPICCLAYIPSLLVSITTHKYIIGIYDTIALILVFIVFSSKKLSIKAKKISFSVIFYLLAVMLVFFLGIEGPGMIILVCTSVLLTLFQSKGAGLISSGLNLVIYAFMLIILDINSTNLILFKEYTLQAWVIIGLNLFAFNILIVLSVSSLIEQLNESFLKEKNLQELLRKESINLLAAKQKAEESERLKSSFLANMSHEIRTPMNGILGFTNLLTEPGLEGKERKEYINMIQKSGARMLDTISDILEFSSIESGNIELDLRETYINELTEYVYNFFKHKADSKGIDFSLKNPLSVRESLIKTDSKKLYTILTNIVKNAIKYTDRGSVEFGYKMKPDVIEFFVSDTGIGIPLDRQEAIFERFIQADIEDKKANQGSGLGLSIAKSYIEVLGGKIWVDSTQGQGSVFYFTIPCLRVERKKTSVDIKTDSSNDKDRFIKDLNILVVEDDYSSGVLLTLMLNKISKKIIFAKTGVEAVDICINNPDIDLILMDIRMPEMNGHEATRQIRMFNKDVIIIAQTAHALEGDREKAIDAGCNDYISKPVIQSKLLSLIQKYFHNELNEN